MRKTKKRKGNSSRGSLNRGKGPEYRPLSAKGKKRQTKPKTTHYGIYP